MRIVDTHLHLIYLDQLSYPWLARDMPQIDRQWDAPSYWAEAETLNIEAALHMEADVPARQIDDENRLVLGLDPRIVGAISNSRPEEADFPAHLERLLQESRIRGIRRLLQSDPDDLSRGQLFRENLRRLPEHGLTFDICVRSRQLGVARELVAACPDVQFILDHCGNPLIASGDISAWRQDLAALAELPNVICKVSGIINHAKPGWTVDDLRPVVAHVIECFGWDRVVWGSDRPVLTVNGTLTQWVQAVREIVGGASADEQSKLFHRNAERYYGAPAGVQRFGQIIGLKPEVIAEYKRIHAAVWPSVLNQIKRSNIRNYTIFLREPENLLFAYYEYVGTDHASDMAKMAEDPQTQAWWKITDPQQTPLPTKAQSEWWARMEEVFHID